MTTPDWNQYGNAIAYNAMSSIAGNVRDIDEILIELKEIYRTVVLQGKK